jgi:hypothetical protein
MDFLKFRSIKKTIEQKNISENLDIDKYYELKWRINTLLTLGTIIGVMIGYLGFDIKSELAFKFTEYKTKTEYLDSLITVLNNKTTAIDSLSNSIERDFSEQIKKVDKYKSDIASLQANVKKDIKDIQEENLRQSQIYIVTNIPITIANKDRAEQKIYYKDLVTNTGNKLPVFKKTPVIQILKNERDAEFLYILENTKEYFKLTYNDPTTLTFADQNSIEGLEKPKTNKFDILISNQ